MALTSVWDTVSDAEIEQSLYSGGRLVRTGIVSGITTEVVTLPKHALLVVVNTAPGIYALGAPLSDAYPSYICTNTVARGISGTAGSKARVWQHFETPGGGGTPLERFAAEDSGSLVVEPVQKIPGLNEMMLCSTGTSDPSLTASGLRANTTTITLSHPHVYRSLVLYGLFADRPNASVLSAANTVNTGTWQGLPRGYWRAEPPRVKYSSRDGMYAVSVGFLTKGKETGDGKDWSSYAIATDPNTGQLWQPKKATMDTLLGQSYEYGKRWAHDGVYKAGLYELSNFSTIFGDTFPIGD